VLLALTDGHTPSEEHALDVRVISTTSRDLERKMRGHRFLQELYYLINGVCLHLPPLRQCKEDIPTLVEYFLSKNATALGLPRPALSSQTLQLLVQHSWPGNIRELQNVTQNIVTMGEERVVADLGSARMASASSRTGVGQGLSLKQIARQASRKAERELILNALTRTHWNRKRAAQELQISYKAFLYKMKQFLENSAGATS
jgi:two-component system, NtrC family, response regulator AtoC